MGWKHPMADPQMICDVCFCAVSTRHRAAHEEYHARSGHTDPIELDLVGDPIPKLTVPEA